MKKKISIKNLYLIGIICIGLTILAVGSTYAMFTAEAEINNPISLASNLTYTSDIIETIDVTVEPVSTKYITLNVTNSTSDTLNYVAWSISNSGYIEVGRNTNTDITAGTISASSNKSIGVYLRNNSGNAITVQVGVSTSKDSVILVSNMKIISNEGLPSVNLSRYVTSMYNNASKTVVTNNSIEYNYAKDSSLMNDRLGGTTTSLDDGNIRYYGASPNNYIYFNCETYPETNCELWRIIGVFGDKIKLIRNESIGEYSWDTSASDVNSGKGVNEWSQADFMKLINSGYESESIGGSLWYNSGSGTCYSGQNNATTSCDFTSTGLKNNTTRNMIAEVTWNLGGWNTSIIYSNQIYGYERGTTVYSGRSTSWTGKIALMYPSDYGYAADLKQCNQTLVNYNNATCRSNNWLYNSDFQWLLTPNSSDDTFLWYVGSSGGVNIGNSVSYAGGVRPVLYLNSDTSIGSGRGSETDPYRIS